MTTQTPDLSSITGRIGAYIDRQWADNFLTSLTQPSSPSVLTDFINDVDREIEMLKRGLEHRQKLTIARRLKKPTDSDDEILRLAQKLITRIKEAEPTRSCNPALLALADQLDEVPIILQEIDGNPHLKDIRNTYCEAGSLNKLLHEFIITLHRIYNRYTGKTEWLVYSDLEGKGVNPFYLLVEHCYASLELGIGESGIRKHITDAKRISNPQL